MGRRGCLRRPHGLTGAVLARDHGVRNPGLRGREPVHRLERDNAGVAGSAAVRLSDRAGCLLAALALAFFCGMHQSNSGNGVAITVRSDVSAVGVLFLLAALWRRVGDRYGYTLRELLPSGRSWAVLAGFLVFGYLWQTAGIHPEFLPRRFGPHLTILGLYALSQLAEAGNNDLSAMKVIAAST